MTTLEPSKEIQGHQSNDSDPKGTWRVYHRQPPPGCGPARVCVPSAHEGWIRMDTSYFLRVVSADMHSKRRSLDDEVPTASKRAAVASSVQQARSIHELSSVDMAAAALLAEGTGAVLVPRLLDEGVIRAFADYVASRPVWPNHNELEGNCASWDRVAIVDFRNASTVSLESAVGYGRGLPPRYSENVACASDALAEVLRPLPEMLSAVVQSDAADTLCALRTQTGHLQFLVRLEFVMGDTCPKWHCDNNISRSLITYAGPGVAVSHQSH